MTLHIEGGPQPEWAVTMFSLTSEMLIGDRTPAQLVEEVIDDGLAEVIEVDAPQYFASYPRFAADEIDSFRDLVDRRGIRLSMLGIYNDFHNRRNRPFDLDETEQYVGAQIQAAAALGFPATRIAFGVAPELLERLAVHAERHDVHVLQEAQGQLRPDGEAFEQQRATVECIGSEKLGFVFDLSVCMPRLPVTYLDELGRAGVPGAAVRYLDDAWVDERDITKVRPRLMELIGHAALTADAAPLLFMPFARFGRTSVADWRDALAGFNAIHLKYWDLEDEDGRVSTPIADVWREFGGIGYTGVVTSEWGGHEWFRDNAPGGLEMTRQHRRMYDAIAAA